MHVSSLPSIVMVDVVQAKATLVMVKADTIATISSFITTPFR
jgi:hypothetical protein